MTSKSVAVTTDKSVAKFRNLEESRSLITRMAARYGVDSDKFLSTIKATCFKSNGKTEVTNEQLCALLVIAEQFGLNIWLKELHAFPGSDGSVTPIIGVDGFIKIANSHPQFGGMTFEYDDEGEWVECIIERKDRSQPTRIREYMAECKRKTSPWEQWPRRMLRHRALCQAVRVAFGFSVMESDEADAWIEGQIKDVTPRGKPETREPQRKLPQKVDLITLDQATVLADMIKAEGIEVNALLARLEVGSLEEIPAARYDEARELIGQLSSDA